MSAEQKQAKELLRQYTAEEWKSAAAFDKRVKRRFSDKKVFSLARNKIGMKIYPWIEKALKGGSVGLLGLTAAFPALAPATLPFAGISYGLGRIVAGHQMYLQNITLGKAAAFGKSMKAKNVPAAVRQKAIELFMQREGPAPLGRKYIKNNPSMIERMANGLTAEKNKNFNAIFEHNVNQALTQKGRALTFKERIDIYKKTFAQRKAIKAEEKLARVTAKQTAQTGSKTLADAAKEVSVQKLNQILSEPVKSAASQAVTKPAPVVTATKETAKRLPLGKKLVEKIGSETMKKTGAKLAGLTAIKVGAKKIPVLGAVFGSVFAAGRAIKGDWTGAGMEFCSGAASCVPGIGTAASLGIDAALLAKDIAGNR